MISAAKLFFLGAAAMLVLSCSKSDSDSSTNPTATGGSMSATVAGTAWQANTVSAVRTSGVLAMVGAQIAGEQNKQININGMVSGTGEYDLAPFASFVSATYAEGTGAGAAGSIAQSGTLVVTELGSRVKGTFSFRTQSGVQITNGTFDIPVTGN